MGHYEHKTRDNSKKRAVRNGQQGSARARPNQASWRRNQGYVRAQMAD
jgi:hypothetical protein